MLDLRPVGYVIGLLVCALGATMTLPMAADLIAGNDHWPAFLEAAALTASAGAMIALACANGVGERLSIQQTFLITTMVWLSLPVFGALPFVLGAPHAAPVDAFFEAMSGLTTTGSTVFSQIENLPEGALLWRSMLQWFGGVGIIVFAMVFLPELRVGGMQIFRSESFETDGKVLPRAAQIAQRIGLVYVILTLACAAAYLIAGMGGFDALNHALTTVATGGFSTRDASFGDFRGGAEYAAVLFMVLASLPFVRYVQLLAGSAGPLRRDSQARTFLAILAAVLLIVASHRMASGVSPEPAIRDALFNVTSIITGTGYASADYQLWGAFPVTLFFFAGLIGGCAGSTCCSIKVFRYQLLFASIHAQIRRIHMPDGVFSLRYDGRPVADDVLSSVMAFFVVFLLTLGIVAVLLGMTGLDMVTSLSGAATALANVGPGLGPTIGPAGNFSSLPDAAKWLLSIAMWIGRLEILAVMAILSLNFWRA